MPSAQPTLQLTVKPSLHTVDEGQATQPPDTFESAATDHRKDGSNDYAGDVSSETRHVPGTGKDSGAHHYLFVFFKVAAVFILVGLSVCCWRAYSLRKDAKLGAKREQNRNTELKRFERMSTMSAAYGGNREAKEPEEKKLLSSGFAASSDLDAESGWDDPDWGEDEYAHLNSPPRSQRAETSRATPVPADSEGFLDLLS